MARGLVLVLFTCVLVGIMSVAEAKEPKASTKTPTSKTTPKAPAKSLKGVVVHVDLEAKSIKIEVKDKQQQVSTVDVATDDKTEFTLDGAAVTLADIRDGMRVTVTPDSGVVSRVVAKSEPKSKSDKK